MSFRPEEVSAILAQELERYEAKLETKSVGSVLSVGDGIARVWGLEDAMAGELIKFPGDIMGMVLNLEEDNVGVVLFGSDKNIKEGDRVESTGRIASVPVGPAMIGRVVNAIGQPVDGKGPIGADKYRNIEFKAPGVSLDEHDNDLMEYATILAAKSNGRLKKFYGYLIGDTINPIRLRGYNRLPGENGFFSTNDVKEPKSQATLGQLYSELLFYGDIVDRARKRIGVYRDRLKLPSL